MIGILCNSQTAFTTVVLRMLLRNSSVLVSTLPLSAATLKRLRTGTVARQVRKSAPGRRLGRGGGGARHSSHGSRMGDTLSHQRLALLQRRRLTRFLLLPHDAELFGQLLLELLHLTQLCDVGAQPGEEHWRESDPV